MLPDARHGLRDAIAGVDAPARLGDLAFEVSELLRAQDAVGLGGELA